MSSQVESEFIQNLRSKINNWSKTEIGQSNQWLKYIQLTPDILHLMIKLSADEALTSEHKAKLAVAISYFMSPMDFIPETYWGVIGFIDDVVLATLALNYIMQSAGSSVITKQWENEANLVNIIGEILQSAEKMVGSDYWAKLQALLK